MSEVREFSQNRSGKTWHISGIVKNISVATLNLSMPKFKYPNKCDRQNYIISDAGKSTIGGQIMALTGTVDKRTLEKYEKEAKEKGRESWYLSWALDTNQEGTLSKLQYFFILFLEVISTQLSTNAIKIKAVESKINSPQSQF